MNDVTRRQQILSKGDSWQLLLLADGRLRWEWNTPGQPLLITSAQPLPLNKSVLVAIVLDAASQRMKLNVYGKADANAPVTADLNFIAWNGTLPVYTDWPLLLGSPRKVVSEVPSAQFDDLRIYQRVIGDEEARLLADPANPGHEQNQDWDNDGLTTAEESLRQTDPRNPDTDGDGLADGEEIHQYHTDPRLSDSDGDGLEDYEELHPQTPRPITRPDRSDTDGDGLWDGEELTVYLTDPNKPDTDNDGMPDEWEVHYGLNPNDPSDASMDPDQDGFTSLQEYLNMRGYVPGLLPGETPWRPNVNDRYSTVEDSDGDGLSDFDEVIRYHTDPFSADTIGDGLGDSYRVRTGLLQTNGTAPPSGRAGDDFDGDGGSNLDEKNAGTDASDGLNQSVHISKAKPITEIPKVPLLPSAPEPTETLGDENITIRKSPTMRVTIQESTESPKLWLVGRIELSDPANPALAAQKIAVNGTIDPQPERNLGKTAESVHRFGEALDVTWFANQIVPDAAGFIHMKVVAKIIKDRIDLPEPTPTPTPTPAPTPTPTPTPAPTPGSGTGGIWGGGFGGGVGFGGFWYYSYGPYQASPPGEQLVNTYSSSDVVVVASGVDLDVKMNGQADYLSEAKEDSPGVPLIPATGVGASPLEAILLARETLGAQTDRLTWDNQQLTVKTGGGEVISPFVWDGTEKEFQVSAKIGFTGANITLAAFNAQNNSLGSDAVNLFLLPVKIEVRNNGSDPYSPTGWTPTKNNGGTLGSWKFETRAIAQPPLASKIQLGIVRDMQFAVKITYEDGSESLCNTPGFIPDSPYPNYRTPTSGGGGSSVFSILDTPFVSVSPTERPYVTEVRDVTTARNFIVMKVGSGEPQLIGEVIWSYTNVAKGTSSSMNTSTQHFSTIISNSTQSPSPIVNSSIQGGSANDKPITEDRSATAALIYINTSANWIATGPPGSIAHTYSRNP